MTLQQSSSNVITTGCFNVTLEEGDAITLNNAYPITDKEGKELTPFTFTIKNSCNEKASYVINLETISTGDKILFDEYVKASLKNNEKELFLSTLNSTNENVEKVIESSLKAYKLTTGVLNANEEKTFELRLWMDENTPTVDDAMNASYMGKITISSSYVVPPNTKNMMVAMDMSDVVAPCVPSEGCDNIYANNLYTQNQKYVVKKVIYQSVMNPIENAVEIVDFSESQDRSVLGYYVVDNLESESLSYTLYIQADGKIKVNPKASYYGVIYEIHYGSTEWSDLPTVSTIEGIENWDTSMVTNMSKMFIGMAGLKSIDLRHFDTTNVTDMNSMFLGMKNLTSLDISNFDTANVTDMYGMFNGVSGLTSLNVSNFDTSKVTNMGEMFSGMSGITSLDVSSFDTSKVINMGGMFSYNSNLTSIVYGSNFIKNADTEVGYMYGRCPANKPIHSSWEGVSFE